jgi:hypothetical protein
MKRTDQHSMPLLFSFQRPVLRNILNLIWAEGKGEGKGKVVPVLN